jgi:hypothetical protein
LDLPPVDGQWPQLQGPFLFIEESSAFQITQAVAEHYDTWNEEKLVARQKKMADAAAGIWRIDFTL